VFPVPVAMFPLCVGVFPRWSVSRSRKIRAAISVAYRTDGVPLEVNDMVLPADRYELSYEWPAD
jgi:hypothetical protein